MAATVIWSRNSEGSLPNDGDSHSLGRWAVWPPVIYQERNLAKYWNLMVTEQQTEIPSLTKLVTDKIQL